MLVINDIKIDPFKDEWINIDKTNCYAYALGIDRSCEELETKRFEPGFTANKTLPEEFNGDELIGNIVTDLDNLGIDFRHVNNNYKLGEGEWRIAIFGGYRFADIKFDDYHFMRQTKDGIWVHKNGYKGKPKTLKPDFSFTSYFDDDVLYSYITTLCLKKGMVKC